MCPAIARARTPSFSGTHDRRKASGVWMLGGATPAPATRQPQAGPDPSTDQAVGGGADGEDADVPAVTDGADPVAGPLPTEELPELSPVDSECVPLWVRGCGGATSADRGGSVLEGGRGRHRPGGGPEIGLLFFERPVERGKKLGWEDGLDLVFGRGDQILGVLTADADSTLGVGEKLPELEAEGRSQRR